MGELIRKELKSFFASLSGYVVLAFFLITSGLFLWIIPGSYNIFDSNMADLQPFFSLAPVLYLFLVPAICMRLFAEERRTGTLELLFTRPLTVWHVVIAKYLAGFILVILSILPTVIYPLSLWMLAQPAGHIDIGGIMGSGVFIRNICCCRRLDFFLDGQSDCCFSVCCGDCFSVVYGVGFYRRNTCFRKYSGLCTAFGHQLSL